MPTYVFPSAGQSARGASIAPVGSTLFIPDWRTARLTAYTPSSSGISSSGLAGPIDNGVTPDVQLSDNLAFLDFSADVDITWGGQTFTAQELALVNDTTTGYSAASGMVGTWLATEASQNVGYCASTPGANSDLWAVGYGEGLLNYVPSTSGVTTYALPFGETFCGVAMASGSPYVLSTSGTFYTIYEGRAAKVAPSLGAPCSQLTADGGVFYALSPAASQVLPYTLSSAFAGAAGTALTTPMTLPYTLTAANGVLGVVGTSPARIAEAANDIFYLAVSRQVLIAQATADTIGVLTLNSVGDWALTQTVAASGSPQYLAATSTGEQCLVSNVASGIVQIINQTDGTWGTPAQQTLDVANCGAVAVSTDNSMGFVCQPASNQVTVLANTSNTWSIDYTLSIPGAQSVLAASSGTVYVGGTSGVTTVTFLNGTWQVGGLVKTTFPVSAVAVDTLGGVYAAGTSGSSGLMSAIFSNTVTGGTQWAGSAEDIAWYEGQIIVLDSTSGLLRTIGLVGGQYSEQASFTAPPSASGLAQLSETWFVGGTQMWEYEWAGAYTVVPVQIAEVGLYDIAGATWASATLGRGRRAFAAAFDSSTNLWVADDSNSLTSYSSGGTQLSQAAIAPYYPQPSTTPLGFSALAWVSGTLYGASCLNNAVVAGL